MLCSVIIPCYNRGLTVGSAIETALNQTQVGVEVIVVNDGSTQESFSDCLRPYLGRIKLINLSKNMGVSAARNIGIQEAINNGNSEYIAFLDSDDIWLDNKLHTQIENMREEHALVSHTGEHWLNHGKWINQGKKLQRFGGYCFEQNLDKCRMSPSSLLLHHSIFKHVGYFDERLKTLEDYDFNLRLSLNYKVQYTPKKLIVKRKFTDDNLSSTILFIEYERLIILTKFLKKNLLKMNSAMRDSAIKELDRKYNIFLHGKGCSS